MATTEKAETVEKEEQGEKTVQEASQAAIAVTRDGKVNTRSKEEMIEPRDDAESTAKDEQFEHECGRSRGSVFSSSSTATSTPTVSNEKRKSKKSVSFREDVESGDESQPGAGRSHPRRNGRPGSLSAVSETASRMDEGQLPKELPDHSRGISFVERRFVPSVGFGEGVSDVVRLSPQSKRSLIVDVIMSSLLMIFYVLSSVLNLFVAVHYFNSLYGWFLVILLLVLVPSAVAQIVSYLAGSNQGTHSNDDFVTLLHIFQLGVISRYAKLLGKGVGGNRNLVLHQAEFLTTLGLFHGCLSNGPQLIVQLYLMIEEKEVSALFVISVCVNAISLAVCLALNRVELRATIRLKVIRFSVMFLWRFFLISSRASAIAVFAVAHHFYVFLILGFHLLGFVVISSVWVIYKERRCLSPLGWFQSLVLSYIHVFDFFNWTEGQTRYRFLIFYSATFLENTLLFIFWYQDENGNWYAVLLACIVWLGFGLGMAFMTVYYQCLHHNQWENRFAQEIISRRGSQASNQSKQQRTKKSKETAI
eukprot:m.25946 g.25946  ORF g.25946 m.25946 type:complete len:533 (+) comp29030_c1_seq2:796-2394(+)